MSMRRVGSSVSPSGSRCSGKAWMRRAPYSSMRSLGPGGGESAGVIAVVEAYSPERGSRSGKRGAENVSPGAGSMAKRPLNHRGSPDSRRGAGDCRGTDRESLPHRTGRPRSRRQLQGPDGPGPPPEARTRHRDSPPECPRTRGRMRCSPVAASQMSARAGQGWRPAIAGRPCQRTSTSPSTGPGSR